MFIASKRNIIIPGGKGREDVTLVKGFVGEAPDWISETAYFKALVKDGKITLSETSQVKGRKKAEKAAKPAKEKTPPEEPGEPLAEAT